jgi:hypothetical protein
METAAGFPANRSSSLPDANETDWKLADSGGFEYAMFPYQFDTYLLKCLQLYLRFQSNTPGKAGGLICWRLKGAFKTVSCFAA